MAKKKKDKERGKSEFAPGHLKKEAGEQSAKPFAPGQVKGEGESAKDYAPGHQPGQPNVSMGAPPKDDYEDGAGAGVPAPPFKKRSGVNKTLIALAIFFAVFGLLYYLSQGG